MAPFFARNRNQFNLGGEFLECQHGAYWGVCAHFTMADEPALVSLPIGTGRTALMMALSFGYEAKRVLVVTPLRLLRDQIADEFKTLRPLKNIGAVDNSIEVPKVFSNKRRLTTIDDWNKLREYDVVVATPRTVSPYEKDVCNPPVDLFDLIFLDEAHHAPAPTWAAILEAFKKTKCILLTSTPYRRDKRTVNAHLVYWYPITRAIDKDIYRPVIYHPVACNGTDSCDQVLCQKAVELLNSQKGNVKPKLLIQTNRLKFVDGLIDLYKAQGLTVEAVTSAKSWKANRATLAALKKGDLDGVVCAGMMGEGLCLPELKIAVLHSAPRSLPFTLQVVGRVPPPLKDAVPPVLKDAVPPPLKDAVPPVLKDAVTRGHLLSATDGVNSVMNYLYVSDPGWGEFIPDLAELVIGAPSTRVRFESLYAVIESVAEKRDINPEHLKPYFSVHIYRVFPGEINLNAIINQEDWPESVNIYFYKSGLYDNTLMVITGTQEEPSWAKGTGIENLRFDLHIFYYNSEKNLFFQATTSEKIARRIRLAIMSTGASLISPSEVLQLLHLGGQYFTVGLRNVVGFGPAQPSYMTLAGMEVQAAVRPSYGRTFALGHALRRLSEDEVRGVSILKGGVWAVKRDNVDEFRKWCDNLAEELRQPPQRDPLQLAFSHNIEKLEDQPLAVQLDRSLLRADWQIETDEAVPVKGDMIPSMEITKFDKDNGRLTCEFCFNSEKPGIKLLYSPTADKVWQKLDDRDLKVKLEFSPQHEFEGDLQYYLEEYPPMLIMPESGVIINQQRWEPLHMPGPLPEECFSSRKWSGCDRTCEDGIPAGDQKNIHDWLEETLKGGISDKAIIIKDHGTGEIADFVVIEPEEKRISFYHCKAMKSAAPAANVTDAYEVLGQACRNSQWILLPALMEELYNRVETRSYSRVIPKDRIAALEEAADSFHCNEWSYQVVVVQPGFHCEKIKQDTTSKIHSLFVSTYELLTACHADFAVWGS